jgi:GNAT superfamily N-acetyltransferase
MTIAIRRAVSADALVVEEMLLEASRWVDALGVTMWSEGELVRSEIERDVNAGMYWIADVDGRPAGAIRFQLEDRLFWPDLEDDDSAFVHRLVVRRAFKGHGVSTALLEWAVDHARAAGRQWLRLDCDAERTKLRALYERFGFRLHSYRQVTSYYVARYVCDVEALGS